MAHIEITGTSYPNENELLQGYKVVSRYKENQGVINVKFSENADTPPGMAEDQIEAHTMGVVLIEHLNMKKGINIFGNRAETTVMKELQKIYDMKTYKPMDASTLT